MQSLSNERLPTMRILFGFAISILTCSQASAATVIQEIIVNEIHSLDGNSSGFEPISMNLLPFDHNLGTLNSFEIKYERNFFASWSTLPTNHSWILYLRYDSMIFNNSNIGLVANADAYFLEQWGIGKSGRIFGTASDSYFFSEIFTEDMLSGYGVVDGSSGNSIVLTPGPSSETGGVGEDFYVNVTHKAQAIYHYTANIEAVPEPSNWSMMILGFGFIGSSLRHSRHLNSKLI